MITSGYRFIMPNGQVFDRTEPYVQESQDGRYHVCKPDYMDEPVCFFAPKAGF